jgi:hypothetical protein
VAGAIVAGHLAWAAPTWETTLAEVCGAALALCLSIGAWDRFVHVWNRGFDAGKSFAAWKAEKEADNTAWERGYEDGKSFAAMKAKEDKQADSAGDAKPK